MLQSGTASHGSILAIIPCGIKADNASGVEIFSEVITSICFL